MERKRIGITGTMGSGKSTAARILSTQIPVNDCDVINSQLLEPGAAGWSALEKKGLLFADSQGRLDRKAMADAMFDHPEIRQQIESVLHPLIVKGMDEWMEKQEGICAVEVPLLFEAGLQDHFDEIWTVVCSEETALQRLENGRHISRQEALRRLALQMDPKKKADLSDAVLYNDRTEQDLKAQILAQLERMN